jgi:Cu+-exporting ATPase
MTTAAAELLPADEADHVAAATRPRGHRVATAGERVDYAPALAAADLGIGTGTEVAAAASDVALLRGGLSVVPVAHPSRAS